MPEWMNVTSLSIYKIAAFIDKHDWEDQVINNWILLALSSPLSVNLLVTR